MMTHKTIIIEMSNQLWIKERTNENEDSDNLNSIRYIIFNQIEQMEFGIITLD